MIQAYNHQMMIILPESFSTGFSTQAAHLAESSGEKLLLMKKWQGIVVQQFAVVFLLAMEVDILTGSTG